MPRRSFRVKTIRLLPEESRIIDRACAALLGMDRSTLMCDAAISQASRLGVYFSLKTTPPLKTSWPYLPQRGPKATSARFTITMNLLVDELVDRGARYVHTTTPLFIIGSTLAYIGRLQKCFTGAGLDSPEQAADVVKKLRAIKLPAQYEYR